MAAGGQSGQASIAGSGYTQADVATLTTFTSAAIAIGAADAGRYVIACIHGVDAATTTLADPTSVTIGGVSATKLAGSTTDYTNRSIWIALVPSGTTAAVSATYARTIIGYGVVAYGVLGIVPTPAYTVISTSASIGAIRKGLVVCFGSTGGDLQRDGAANVVPAGTLRGMYLTPSGLWMQFSASHGLPSLTENIFPPGGGDPVLAVSFAPA